MIAALLKDTHISKFALVRYHTTKLKLIVSLPRYKTRVKCESDYYFGKNACPLCGSAQRAGDS